MDTGGEKMHLEVRDLCRYYHQKGALKNVSFELPPGSVCLLLGPNGSGKTTLMKLIAGLVSKTGGQILLDGERLRTRDKACVAYMPTENFFYNYMTVRDAGKYYRDFFDDFDFSAYEDMIERSDLSMKSAVRTLSSGMSAKLRLALTLSRDADLMMFDEPINGVDMLTRDWVLQEIAQRCNDERIILISTHLVEEAEHLANRALFLKKGRLVREGELTQLCQSASLEDQYREIYGRKAEKKEEEE